MNNTMHDEIHCLGLALDCEIGFHPTEKGLLQTLVLDLRAQVDPIAHEKREQPQALKFDYYEATQMIRKNFSGKHFALIETVAEDVANLLLERFSVRAIEVTVTKRPIDMPGVDRVAYVCRRLRVA